MKEKLRYNFYKEKKEYYQKIVNTIASIRLIIFILLIISFIGKYYYYRVLLSFIFMISFILFIILVMIHDKIYKQYNYYTNYLEIIETYIKRTTEEWKEFSDTGSDFLKNSPYYYQDLDIFGDSSLFQLISVCKTLGGREKLKERLSNIKYSKQKLKEEQEAIQELANNPHIMIDFCVLLSQFDHKKINLSKDLSILDKNKKKLSKIDVAISIICTIIVMVLLILSLLKIISTNIVFISFIFNYLISVAYTYIYKDDFKELETFITHYKGVNNIFKSYCTKNYQSKKLNNIKKEIHQALNNGKKLDKLDTINSLSTNIISNFLLNGLCCINIFLLNFYNNYKSEDLIKIRVGVSNIEELEALCSLATIGVIFNNTCLPTMTDEVEIQVNTLYHPLLGEKKCIPNDFKSKNGINIITGSNMGGKTSFLRTIGINIILMNSGTFVCAKEMKASYFKIFTSMRVNDDISNGISTFYGELLRIKEMVEYIDKETMLVLIDEIFKGTNYQDRIYGAKQVIERLNTNKTITLLTTHDFELCEEKNIENYHVKESYEKDRIIFDYKIRKGKCTSTNARFLMNKLGIIQK